MSEVLRNFESIEGTLNNTTETKTFNKKSRYIIIKNDHASGDLKFKFSASESYGTLLFGETFSLSLTGDLVIINTTETDMAYRIWVFG